MTDPTPQNDVSRVELRKRRQTRRRFAVIALVVLILVAGGGVFFATRDNGSDTAAPKPATTAALSQAAAGLSTGFGVAPMRAATTKGGDIAVFATPDPAAAPVSMLTP